MGLPSYSGSGDFSARWREALELNGFSVVEITASSEATKQSDHIKEEKVIIRKDGAEIGGIAWTRMSVHDDVKCQLGTTGLVIMAFGQYDKCVFLTIHQILASSGAKVSHPSGHCVALYRTSSLDRESILRAITESCIRSGLRLELCRRKSLASELMEGTIACSGALVNSRVAITLGMTVDASNSGRYTFVAVTYPTLFHRLLSPGVRRLRHTVERLCLDELKLESVKP